LRLQDKAEIFDGTEVRKVRWARDKFVSAEATRRNTNTANKQFVITLLDDAVESTVCECQAWCAICT
jgi:hypothetical protein